MRRSTADAATGASVSTVSLAVSAVLSVGTLTLAAVGTGLASGEVAQANARAVAAGSVDAAVLSADGSALGIAASNLSAVGLLVAGAALIAIPTLLGLMLIDIGVGVAAASIVAALGPLEMLSRIAPYVVVEAGGVLLAATAGMLPLTHACISRLRTGQPLLPSYTSGLHYSLRLTAVAALLILLSGLVWLCLIGLALLLLLVRLPLFIEAAVGALAGLDGEGDPALTDPALTEAATTVGAVGAVVLHAVVLAVVAVLASLMERWLGPTALGAPAGRLRIGVAGLVFALLALGQQLFAVVLGIAAVQRGWELWVAALAVTLLAPLAFPGARRSAAAYARAALVAGVTGAILCIG